MSLSKFESKKRIIIAGPSGYGKSSLILSLMQKDKSVIKMSSELIRRSGETGQMTKKFGCYDVPGTTLILQDFKGENDTWNMELFKNTCLGYVDYGTDLSDMKHIQYSKYSNPNCASLGAIFVVKPGIQEEGYLLFLKEYCKMLKEVGKFYVFVVTHCDEIPCVKDSWKNRYSTKKVKEVIEDKIKSSEEWKKIERTIHQFDKDSHIIPWISYQDNDSVCEFQVGMTKSLFQAIQEGVESLKPVTKETKVENTPIKMEFGWE